MDMRMARIFNDVSHRHSQEISLKNPGFRPSTQRCLQLNSWMSLAQRTRFYGPLLIGRQLVADGFWTRLNLVRVPLVRLRSTSHSIYTRHECEVAVDRQTRSEKRVPQSGAVAFFDERVNQRSSSSAKLRTEQGSYDRGSWPYY